MMTTKTTIRLFIASLLAINLVAASSSDDLTRQNDTAESTTTTNSTKYWSTSLVSAPNPDEEYIFKHEGNRDKSVSDLGKKKAKDEDPQQPSAYPENEEVILYFTQLPDEYLESYDGETKPESPHLEEDILNMEQNRELNLNENLDTLPFQETPEFVNSDLNKQLNSSASMNSPVEEGILGAENDRDESMTNIFQSGGSNEQMREYGSDYNKESNNKDKETKDNDGPKFEFLIGAAPVQLSTVKQGDGSSDNLSTRKPFVPPKSAWPVPQAQFLTTEPKFYSTSATLYALKNKPSVSVETAEDYVELVEISKNSSVENSGVGINKTLVFPFHGNGSNRTEHYVENDGPDSSFTDLQTLFLACFATLVPLFIALMLACGLRMAWRRYRRGGRRSMGYGSGLRSGVDGGSSDPITDKRDQCNDLKSAESGFSTRNGESKEMTGNSTSPTQNQPANGSIITMTLKNNHLIVETEVRDDIIQGSRETKMKYSSNNDGVFVVEVQQSNSHPMAHQGSPERRALVHHSPITNMPNSIAEESQESLDSLPPPSSKQTFGSTNTGLSTSDLSLSSSGSHNPSYAYGNQTGYEQGQYGYPIYAGYVPPPVSGIPCETSREPLIVKTPSDNDKPVVTAAIFKQDSIISLEDSVKPGEYNIEGSTDGPLLSDIQARELSLHKLQDKLMEGGNKHKLIANCDSLPTSDTEDDKIQEQQRQLGNGQKEQTVVEINHDKSGHPFNRADSLPPRLTHELATTEASPNKNKEENFDIIEEECSMDCYPGDIASGSPLLCHSAGIAAANARHKRASLPIITPDLYSSIKQTTKSILPSLSPKFEKFNNDSSPMDSCERQGGTPLITVTEEADGCETEGTQE